MLAACGGAGTTPFGNQGTGGGEGTGSSSGASSSGAGSGGDDASASLDGPVESSGPATGSSGNSTSSSGASSGGTSSGSSSGTASSSGDSSPEAGSAFDPLSLSGLVLWLDANENVTSSAGGGVSGWGDLTSNHNDASQPTAALQPTFVVNAVNGLPGLDFDSHASGGSAAMGNLLAIKDSTSLRWGTADFYVVVVADFDNDLSNGLESGVGAMFTKATGTSFAGPALTANILGPFSQNNVGLGFSTSNANGNYVITQTPYNDGNPHAFAMQRVGSTLGLRVDGASVGTSTSSDNDVSSASIAVTIGALSGGQALRLDGDVAEILAVSGVLSDGDRGSIETYLEKKYSLP